MEAGCTFEESGRKFKRKCEGVKWRTCLKLTFPQISAISLPTMAFFVSMDSAERELPVKPRFHEILLTGQE
jgi:hypothetical protein